MKTATRHNSLNTKQIRILKLLFKFRFISVPLLLEYTQAKSLASISKALKILQGQEYLARRYNNSYKLQGKAARYYLAKKALTYLRDEHGMDETVLHTMYKNKTVGELFMDHHLDIFKAFMCLSASYLRTFSIYTKYELGGLDYFPAPAPDLYLSRNDSLESATNHFFLDVFTDTQFFVIKKRLEQYLEHYESGDWEADQKTGYPVILIACPDGRTEEKLQTHTSRLLDTSGIDDLIVCTTTTKALKVSSGSSAIWTKTSESERTFDLSKL